MTKKEKEYLQRLEDRCNILRTRRGDEAKMELHALEWALTKLWSEQDDDWVRNSYLGDG